MRIEDDNNNEDEMYDSTSLSEMIETLERTFDRLETKKKHTKRTLLGVGLAPFIIFLLISIAQAIKYNEPLAFLLYFSTNLIENPRAFCGLIFIFLSLLINPKEEQSEDMNDDVFVTKKRKHGKMEKKTKYKLFIFLGLVPLIFLLTVGILTYYTGFTFFIGKSYGINAAIDSITIVLFLFWPYVVIGLFFSLIGIFKLKKEKKKEEEL